VKIGDHVKAALFILSLTERLKNPLFPDLKEYRILAAVAHFFRRSRIGLFYLVEALPSNNWNKPHQKPLLTAAEL